MIWIFGDSLSTAYNLADKSLGWPAILGKKLNSSYKNFAQRSADNFFIYSSYYENLKDIKKDDIVIIVWSHHNRKSFVLDRDNSTHIDNIVNGKVFKVKDKEFFRSQNPVNDNRQKMLSLLPKVTGNAYYDTWFNNYYSEYEQLRHLQCYQDSVTLNCPGRYYPYFFNDVLNWIKDNNVAISQNDQHFNKDGHRLWAKKLLEEINDVPNNRII